MNVRIIGEAAPAAVAAGVLAAERQEVVWNPGSEDRLKELRRRREIRLNLPWGWVKTGDFGLSSSPVLKGGEAGVAVCSRNGVLKTGADGRPRAAGGRSGTLLLLDGDPGAAGGRELKCPIAAGTVVVRGISLLDALEWDPGIVEISSPQPRLIVESGADLAPLFRCLKAQRIAVQEVDDLSPFRNAIHLRDLLDLPVALCHSTLDNFLSYPEGREIAVSVLEEGVKLYSHKDLPLGKLPFRDPQDLLQRLKRKPEEFDKKRASPDRAFGPALPGLLDGAAKSLREPHERIVRMSARSGIDPAWNWAIPQKITHAIRVGFYRDPVELFNALS
jgi:hypothetical protein